jgi:integrase
MSTVTRATLANPAARQALPQRKRPYYVNIDTGLSLGYRSNAGPGTWSAQIANGKRGASIKALGVADDIADRGLSFADAETKARTLRGGTAIDGSKIITVKDAIELWRNDLIARNGSPKNADDLLPHVLDALAKRPIKLLTAIELRMWRDSLRRLRGGKAPLQATSKTRICKNLRAALTTAAKLIHHHDHSAWNVGLESLPDSSVKARNNSNLTVEQISRIVQAAYSNSPQRGLLIETLAEIGARFSQVARLTVADLLLNSEMSLPTAMKGKKHKKFDKERVQITPTLAMRLRQAAGNRAPDQPLLLNSIGNRWTGSAARSAMIAAVKAAGIGSEVTAYWLRHSSMQRVTLAVRDPTVVAKLHNTSVAMIEKHYCKHILENAETIKQVRAALVDFSASNVVPFKAA